MFSLLSPIIFTQTAGLKSEAVPASPSFSHSGASRLAGADSCRVCHATGSDMTLATNQLCFECHKPEETKSRKIYQHPDIPDDKYSSLDCEGCHKLHMAYARPLLVQSQTGLCYSCHPETREHKSHPVIVFDKGFGPQTITGPDGKVITCASHCHDLHGTDFKYLCRKEPGRELCISCHKEFE